MDSYCEDFIKQSKDFFGDIRKANTPAYPGKVLAKKKEDEETIENEQYRSFVGTALYMIKKISPESSNAIRELSSSLDGPSKDHWRAAMRYIGY